MQLLDPVLLQQVRLIASDHLQAKVVLSKETCPHQRLNFSGNYILNMIKYEICVVNETKLISSFRVTQLAVKALHDPDPKSRLTLNTFRLNLQNHPPANWKSNERLPPAVRPNLRRDPRPVTSSLRHVCSTVTFRSLSLKKCVAQLRLFF